MYLVSMNSNCKKLNNQLYVIPGECDFYKVKRNQENIEVINNLLDFR